MISKGKGKGKGRGKSKGVRSSGKGAGRRKNPRGKDGQITKCFGNNRTCGSEDHLKRDCPHETGPQGNKGKGTFTFDNTSEDYVNSCEDGHAAALLITTAEEPHAWTCASDVRARAEHTIVFMIATSEQGVHLQDTRAPEQVAEDLVRHMRQRGPQRRAYLATTNELSSTPTQERSPWDPAGQVSHRQRQAEVGASFYATAADEDDPLLEGGFYLDAADEDPAHAAEPEAAYHTPPTAGTLPIPAEQQYDHSDVSHRDWPDTATVLEFWHRGRTYTHVHDTDDGIGNISIPERAAAEDSARDLLNRWRTAETMAQAGDFAGHLTNQNNKQLPSSTGA